MVAVMIFAGFRIPSGYQFTVGTLDRAGIAAVGAQSGD
jgi:hypothetical protein